MELITQVQILNETVCVSLHAYSIEKDMTPSTPFSYGKIVGQAEFFLVLVG